MSRFKKFIREEFKRDSLARTKNFKDFKRTYKNRRITNLNSGKFWDRKFKAPELFENLDPMSKEKISFITSLLAESGQKILDLGIGQGYLEQSLKLKKISHQIFGVDISPVSIQRARKQFKGKFIVADIMDIKKHYKRGFFDTIVALEVIEHVAPGDIFSLYGQVSELLKTGGRLIISTPLNEGLLKMSSNPSAHLREYTIPILKTEFELAGYAITNMKTFYAFNNFYGFKKIISKVIPNKWRPNNVVIEAVKVK